MTKGQQMKWKTRQMIELRLMQAREAKLLGQADHRLWCIKSALMWRIQCPKRRFA